MLDIPRGDVVSAARGAQALGDSPEESTVGLVVALAAAPHLGLLDVEDTARAGAVLASVLVAAMGAGFVDGDLLQLLAARRRWTGLIEELAAEVVERIGGPDEFFSLLDLSTTIADWIGLEE